MYVARFGIVGCRSAVGCWHGALGEKIGVMKLNGIDDGNLLDLYAENFPINGDTLRDLAYTVDDYEDNYDGSVNAGIENFVDSAFHNDMYKRRKDGCSFDEYVVRIRFPYGKETFTGYLRGVWDDAVCPW